jgi:hypothetical protein
LESHYKDVARLQVASAVPLKIIQLQFLNESLFSLLDIYHFINALIKKCA